MSLLWSEESLRSQNLAKKQEVVGLLHRDKWKMINGKWNSFPLQHSGYY